MIIKDNKKIKPILSDEKAKNTKLNLQTADGRSLGEVSASAYSAIRGNYLDRYSPIDENEKKVLDEYKKYTSAQKNSKETQGSNDVFKRYNIDPDNFTYNDLVKWAGEHNHNMSIDSSMQPVFTPKYQGGFLGIGSKKLSTDQEDADLKVLQQLAANNGRKEVAQKDLGGLYSAAVGVGEGVTLGAIKPLVDWKAKKDYEKAGLDSDKYVSPSAMREKTEQSHRVANAVGNIVGSTLSYKALGAAVSGATQGLKWVAKTPQWVQSAINSGITFAIADGANTAFDGGNIKSVIRSAGIGLVGGAAGSSASSAVSHVGEKLLFNKSLQENIISKMFGGKERVLLQHRVIPEIVLGGASSVAFAGGKTASTYFLYPKDYRPTAEQMAKDISVAFAFGAISRGIGIAETSKKNKKYLDSLYQKMAYDYEKMAKSSISGKNDILGARKFAKNVIDYSDAMEAYLTGKEYNANIDGKNYTFMPNRIRLVGQAKYVDSILSELQTIRNGANAVLNGVAAPENGLSTVPAPTTADTASSATAPVSSAAHVSVGEKSTAVQPIAAPPEVTMPADAVGSSAAPVLGANDMGGSIDSGAERLAPQSASDDIKKLEDVLIAQGTDDTSRRKIVGTALEIEQALTGNKATVRNVLDDVSKITSRALAKMKGIADSKNAYWSLFGENLKAIPSGNVKENAEMIQKYSEAYAGALKNSAPEAYTAAIIAQDGTDLTQALPRTIMQNVLPTKAKDAGAYRLVAARIENILRDVDAQISTERKKLYGTAGKPAATTEKQSVPKLTAAKKGDWASHDVYWYAPGSKTVVAYSTKAASDLIEALTQDYPRATISEIQAVIPYDTEAKKVLQAYIDNGYGNEIASKHFKDVQRSAASSLTQPVGNDIMKVNQTKGVEKDGQSREGSQETGIKQTDILGLRGHDGRGYDRAGSERLRLYLGRGNRKDNSGSVEGFGGNRQEDRRYFGESVGERNQLIVNGGKSLANYVQIPETLYTDEMRSIAENNNRYGVDTIFTVGDISFRNFDDTTRKVPATVVDGKMFIDANLDAVLSDVSNHEMVHYAIRKLAAETNQDALNIARNLMTSVRSYMKPESFREVFGISTQLVRANYQNVTKFNLLDEFCAEMGYLVRYHETSDWFSDYEGAVRLFDNLLALEPQKHAWLQEVIKKDDASFKSKSEATNDSSSLGETSPTNSISQDNKTVNSTEDNNIENANILSSAPETTKSTVTDGGILQNSVTADNRMQSTTEEGIQKFSRTYDDARELIRAINRGEDVSLDIAKEAATYTIQSEAEIKAALSALKNDALKRLLSPLERSRYTKKAEMVSGVYTDLLERMYYAITGKNTISYIFDGTSYDVYMKNMLQDAMEQTTPEKFNAVINRNAEAYKKTVEKRQKAAEALENPKTYEDFRRKQQVSGLSEEETIRFEELYAEKKKEDRAQKKAASGTAKVTENADTLLHDPEKYTIEQTKHTKTGEDVWVVKLKERIDSEAWKQLNEQMKALGGSYWRGNGGWNFKKNPLAGSEVLHAAENAGVSDNGKSVDKLRALADSMQKSIDEKFKDRLTNTAKRAQEAANAERAGDKLKFLQETIRNVAEGIDSGNVRFLDSISSRAQFETMFDMLRKSQYERVTNMDKLTYSERMEELAKPFSEEDVKRAILPLARIHKNVFKEYLAAAEGKKGFKQLHERLEKSYNKAKGNYVYLAGNDFADIDKIVKTLSTTRDTYWNDMVAAQNRLARMGIDSNAELRTYLRELLTYLPGENAEVQKERSIKAKERELANSKIEGFFPTPKETVLKMLNEADIKDGETVLEPSAGKGNIADEIKAQHPHNNLDVVEYNGSLRELLTEKGYNVVGSDFLETKGTYDKIVMNPPFEKGQDIDHVMHAYDLLKNGGRVVAIMSEGSFFRSDKKSESFRSWLDEVGGISEKLPEGTFKNAERSTGVNTRLVVIDKSENASTFGQLITDYSGAVDDILTVEDSEAKKFADKRAAIEVSKNTPRVILDHVEGAKDLRVIINYNKLYLAVRKDGVFKGHYHNLGAEIAKKLTEFLNNPDAIIQLANGRLNLFANVKTKRGNNGIISVELNSTKNIDDKFEDYNVVVTMFSSDDKYVQNLLSGDGITVKYKREDLSQVNPQLYKWLAIINDNSSANNIVSQDNGIVNHNSMQKPKDHSDFLHDGSTVRSSRDDAGVDSASRWTTGRVESHKDSNVNIADIIKGIRDKFGIPIVTGKVTDRTASGIYKETPETIRIRIANNLPTVSHELGHHLDKMYHFSRMESVEALKSAVDQEFLDQYADSQKAGEAVAEFVRVYLKNTNEANRLCPDFYSDFISTLSKEDLKAVNEIASSINEYMSYNISERYDAATVSSQQKEKLPFRERWHNFYTDWVDSFHPQKRVTDYVMDVSGGTLSGAKNAYVLATNSLNAHTIANFLVCEGFRDLNGNIVDAKSFVDCIGMVDSKNVKLLDKYLMLRHSLEWIAPLEKDVAKKRVFADDTLENVEEIKKQLAEIEEKYPEIKTAAENLYEYQNNILKYFVIPAGGMTEGTLSALNRKYPSYVPFYRAVGKRSGVAKGTFANQRSPIMRAKGSGELILSPTESIIRNTEKMVKFALRNQVMDTFASYADTVEGLGQFMEAVPPDMVPHTIDITGQKEKFADILQQVVSSGDEFFAITDLMDEIFGDAVTDFTPITNASKKIITVWRNGKPAYYQIHDASFYNSVAELSPRQAEGLLRISQKIMQPMKLLITQNNPIFALTNAMRDIGTAYKLSEINNPATFAVLYVRAIAGIVRGDEIYIQYKAMGGGHSSELSANIEDISKTLRRVARRDMGLARRLAYSVFLHPVDTVAKINDAVESLPRLMEFKRTLDAGGDLQQAIYNADDITQNFKRHGSGATAKAFNKVFIFFNAAIQGLDKLFRTITDKDPKKRYKTLLKWVLHALIMGIIGWVWNREVDEEGYKNLSSYKKNNFYNFAIGDSKFISLPKPRENAILDSFTERTIEYLAGENQEAFYDFGNYLTSQLLPPGVPDTFNPVDAAHSTLGSTVLGGLADVGFNTDFKGAPIESKYDESLPSHERYSDNTTQLAYHLGQTRLARQWDMSPKKIDHLLSSYTGILSQVNKALLPVNKNRRDTSIGLRNKFISDSNYSTDVLNRVYENKDKAEKAFVFEKSPEAAVQYEQNSVVSSYLSGMNQAIRALPDEEQRNGRIYLLKVLNAWGYDNTKSQNVMLERLGDTDVSQECILTSVPDSELEWTKNKVKYSYQMTPREYTEYVKDYLALVENYRAHANKSISNDADYVTTLQKTKAEVRKVMDKKYKQMYAEKAVKIQKAN